MKPFDYLAVITSVIVGLGITQLLTASGVIFVKYSQVHLYCIPIIWAVILFVAQIEFWWWCFRLRDSLLWEFFDFIFLLLSPVIMYFLSVIVFPTIGEVHETQVEMKHYYFEHHLIFLGGVAVSISVDIIDSIRRTKQLIKDGVLGFQLLLLLIVLLGLIITNEALHVAIAFISLILLLSFIYYKRQKIN
jgi:hypothetical protein